MYGAIEIPEKSADAGIVPVDGHDASVILHEVGHMGRFPPGGRAQIENPFSRACSEGRRGHTRGGLLDVEETQPVFDRIGDGVRPVHHAQEVRQSLDALERETLGSESLREIRV
jgi:hypothetical protein